VSDAGGANDRPAEPSGGRPGAAGTGRTVLVDLGRSHVRVVAPGVDVRTDRGAGLADAGGPVGAARLCLAAVHAALDADPAELAVCAPGVVTDPGLARAFADALAAGGATAVTVVSDSAAWQAGAFAGGDGAVVAVGTGAVVVARSGDTVTRLDGLGLLLGDVGGGAWIGREALAVAARSAGGLRDAAVARFGPPADWPGLLGVPDLAGRLAGFVPDVVAAADAGDPDAGAVLEAAARGLAETLDPLPDDLPVALVGGLAGPLGVRLRAIADRRWVEPAGDAVDGLRALLSDPGPFEVFRATAVTAAHDTDSLPTEAIAPDTLDLDTWPTVRLVARLADGHRSATQAVVDAAEPLAKAADLVGTALTGRGRLFYVGAGTPGRLAVQDAAELVPTFGLDPERAIVLLAGGHEASELAIEGAEDDAGAGAADVDAVGVGPDDVVVGISASGRTPYVLAAIDRAAERGAATVGLANVPGSALAQRADIAVELLTGAEVLAGSTRLAAGTAEKIALNTLSTAALVRAGATYGPWMVGMLATNDKLRRRALRIVRSASGVDEATAVAALEAAEGSMAVALVALLGDLDTATARERLATAGSVRAAVGTDPAARP
jgi:N-acetylmuramic acid 6-phosphate etherase